MVGNLQKIRERIFSAISTTIFITFNRLIQLNLDNHRNVTLTPIERPARLDLEDMRLPDKLTDFRYLRFDEPI